MSRFDVLQLGDPIEKTAEELRQSQFIQSSMHKKVGTEPRDKHFSFDSGDDESILTQPPLKPGYTGHIGHRELIQARDI